MMLAGWAVSLPGAGSGLVRCVAEIAADTLLGSQPDTTAAQQAFGVRQRGVIAGESVTVP